MTEESKSIGNQDIKPWNRRQIKVNGLKVINNSHRPGPGFRIIEDSHFWLAVQFLSVASLTK